MSEITSAMFEKAECALKIHTTARFNSLTTKHLGFSLKFDLESDLQGVSVELYLSLDSICDLVNSAYGYIAQEYDSNLDLKPIEVLRRQGNIFRILDNETIQFVTNYSDFKDVVDFMWIMRDQKIIKNVLDSQTKHKAADLLYELETRWWGKNPDRADQAEIEQGMDAMRRIVGFLYKNSGVLFPLY